MELDDFEYVDEFEKRNDLVDWDNLEMWITWHTNGTLGWLFESYKVFIYIFRIQLYFSDLGLIV